MIKFINLSIEGFCSIQSLVIPLHNNGITIINGENGAGKSTILNALYWCLYGKALKDVTEIVTKENLQPKDYRGVIVKVQYEINNSLHLVIRCKDFRGKVGNAIGKNRLIYLIDDNEVNTKGKSNIQKEIENNLMMGPRLFKNSVIFGQKLKRIAQETGPDKKALFEEAFEVGYLTKANQIAKVYKKEKEDELKELSASVRSYEEQYNDVKETYLDLYEKESNFKESQKEEIKELKKKKKILERDIENVSDKIFEMKGSKYSSKLEKLKEKKRTLTEKFHSNKDELNDLTDLEGVGKFAKKVLRLLIRNKSKSAIKELKTLITKIEDLDNYYTSKDILDEKIGNLIEESRKIDNYNNKIVNLEYEVSRIEKEIKKVSMETTMVMSPKYKKKKVEIYKKLVELKKQKDKVVKEYEDYEWLIKDPLGNSGLKTYIFNSSLKELNECLDDYSVILGFNISFNVDEKSNKRDFITLIEKNGQLFDYAEFSGGEEQLVDIAMALALHQITTISKGISLLFLDELFESLDKDNVEIVIELIKHISQDKSIFIITHKDNFYIGNSKSINLTKGDNGLTTITQ